MNKAEYDRRERLRRKVRNLFPEASTMKCFDCGKRAHDYDHYKGYDEKNWYEVQPVCVSCHAKRSYMRGERLPPWTGKKRSLKDRRAMSRAAIGRVMPKDQREKLSRALKLAYAEGRRKRGHSLKTCKRFRMIRLQKERAGLVARKANGQYAKGHV